MDAATLFDVKRKVVLVTGGAKGIGRGISEGFVANGAKVYITSRDAKACEQACKELNALGMLIQLQLIKLSKYSSKGSPGKGSAHYITADFYKLEDCKRLAETLMSLEPKLHVLVNNSGSSWGAPYAEFPDAAWTRVLTLNLTRVFTITQLVTPLLELHTATRHASLTSALWMAYVCQTLRLSAIVRAKRACIS